MFTYITRSKVGVTRRVNLSNVFVLPVVYNVLMYVLCCQQGKGAFNNYVDKTGGRVSKMSVFVHAQGIKN